MARIFGLGLGYRAARLLGPSTTLTAEVFPTRSGVANGVVWATPILPDTLFPFVTIGLQQSTGSFTTAFLCIPVMMIGMAVGVYFTVPEHSGKELNAIIV